MQLFVVVFLVITVFSSPPISQGNFINSGTPSNITLSFDCTVRQYAYSYGKSMQPRHNSFVELFDALQLSACNITRPPSNNNERIQPRSPPIRVTTPCTFYIDSNNGNDNNDGSISSPFQTIQKGITSTRNNRSSSTEQCILYLRNGTFYISQPILLTSQDSYLIISNYENEQVIISGAIPLKYGNNEWTLIDYKPIDWYTYNNSNNCWGRSGTNTSNDLIKWFGSYSTLNECLNTLKNAQLSNKYGTFYSLCWNDPIIGKPYGGECYGIHDISWQPTIQDNIYSSKYEWRNIWSIKINNVEEIGNNIPGLRVGDNGIRGIRARYPDQIPERAMQFDPISGWIPYTTKWLSPSKDIYSPIDVIYTADNYTNDINVDWPMLIPGFNDSDQYTGMGDWGEYHIGVGGTCNKDGIQPNYGYWCSADPPRGSEYQHISPDGIYLNYNNLPNAPYNNITGAVFQTWRPAHWFTMMFDVDSNQRFNQQTNLVNFSYGGFQGGEGTSSGAEWYIENVYEELTIPNEYFYNVSTNILYFFYNSTEKIPPPHDLTLSATHNKVLFNISGSQQSPVINVTFHGLTFRDTAYTYLDPHGFPSGGDWGLQNQGAISIEGGEYVHINSSLFTRLDGNAIFIGGYNRNITISNNDFEWIGDSVIASWGYSSSPLSNNNHTNVLPNGGPDGRNGEQPRFNHIYNNLIREIGLFQKQSSAYFQAVSCQSIIENNIFFNGPRAAINWNDAFGGANIMRYNLLINAVRESGDHGPFNSWDRVPYITNVNAANNGGKSSIVPAFNEIYQNFVLGTYETQEGMDNDDGSAQYLTHNNFFVYGSNGLKSDFNGNTNHHYQNIYAYIDTAYGFMSNTGAYNQFRNNSVIFKANSGEYSSTCVNVPGFIAEGNTLYNPSGEINCCGTTLQKWVDQGNDPGTTINKLPTDQQIIQMAEKILKPF